MLRTSFIQGLLSHVQYMQRFQASDFVPFEVEGQRLGYIHHEHLPWLEDWREVFELFPQKVTLHPALTTPERRTQAVDEVVSSWVQQGFLAPHSEYYDLCTAWGATPPLKIMRGAHRIFGGLSFGVHVTGYQQIDQQLYMWVGERSEHKSTYPGKLDTFVAGGRPSGMLPMEVVIKECKEEANLHPSISQTARAVGAITYCRQQGYTLERDTMFVFDLEIPQGVTPEPDGEEVAAFHCWPVNRVMEVVSSSHDFKDNCNLVIIDFLIRHGMLSANRPDYLQLVNGLHQALDVRA